MRWGETHDEYRERMTTWRVRFAWWPVRLDDGRWVWLEQFKRRSCFGFLGIRWTERCAVGTREENPQ